MYYPDYDKTGAFRVYDDDGEVLSPNIPLTSSEERLKEFRSSVKQDITRNPDSLASRVFRYSSDIMKMQSAATAGDHDTFNNIYDRLSSTVNDNLEALSAYGTAFGESKDPLLRQLAANAVALHTFSFMNAPIKTDLGENVTAVNFKEHPELSTAAGKYGYDSNVMQAMSGSFNGQKDPSARACIAPIVQPSIDTARKGGFDKQFGRRNELANYVLANKDALTGALGTSGVATLTSYVTDNFLESGGALSMMKGYVALLNRATSSDQPLTADSLISGTNLMRSRITGYPDRTEKETDSERAIMGLILNAVASNTPADVKIDLTSDLTINAFKQIASEAAQAEALGIPFVATLGGGDVLKKRIASDFAAAMSSPLGQLPANSYFGKLRDYRMGVMAGLKATDDEEPLSPLITGAPGYYKKNVSQSTGSVSSNPILQTAKRQIGSLVYESTVKSFDNYQSPAEAYSALLQDENRSTSLRNAMTDTFVRTFNLSTRPGRQFASALAATVMESYFDNRKYSSLLDMIGSLASSVKIAEVAPEASAAGRELLATLTGTGLTPADDQRLEAFFNSELSSRDGKTPMSPEEKAAARMRYKRQFRLEHGDKVGPEYASASRRFTDSVVNRGYRYYQAMDEKGNTYYRDLKTNKVIPVPPPKPDDDNKVKELRQRVRDVAQYEPFVNFGYGDISMRWQDPRRFYQSQDSLKQSLTRVQKLANSRRNDE